MEKSIWSYRDISVKLELLLYNTLILPIAIYGSERLSLMQLDTKKLSILKNNICVCCMISCSELFLSQDGIFHCFTGFTKKIFLSPTTVATFSKHESNFPILRKCQQVQFCRFCFVSFV